MNLPLLAAGSVLAWIVFGGIAICLRKRILLDAAIFSAAFGPLVGVVLVGLRAA